MGHFVAVRSRAEVLPALATGLSQFGAAGGEPEWLVGGVWLCTRETQHLATASVEVLPDGHVARPLNICTAAELVAQIEADLPDVSGRLISRGSGIQLEQVPSTPPTPGPLEHWPSEPYSLSVLVRASQRASDVNRVGCGLLFRSENGRALLVGTDNSSLAMVLSEEPKLIEHYCTDCDVLTIAEYLQLCSR